MHRFSVRSAIIALFFLTLIGTSACGGDAGTPPPPAVEGRAQDTADRVDEVDVVPADTARADTAKVTVEDFQFTKLEDGTRVFLGVLYNPTSKPIAVAQIQIALYNAQNVRVGKAKVTVEDIPPGERKPFREPLTSDHENVQAADVRSVLVM